MQKWAKKIQQAKYALVSNETRVPHPPPTKIHLDFQLPSSQVISLQKIYHIRNPDGNSKFIAGFYQCAVIVNGQQKGGTY